MSIRMVNVIEEDMNKCLSKFQENTNKHLYEIMKTMRDMKEEFDKNIEILKKTK
jgi:hypothetical protein